MTVQEAIKEGAQALAHHEIDESRLEAEILLMHVLQVNRAHLYASLQEEISSDSYRAYLHLIERRLAGESTWYIIGHREFFGLDFVVDPRVLVPRPETEMLVERALGIIRDRSVSPCEIPLLADIGTGSGAIAVSLAIHLPNAKIYATDISADALEVAATNCKKHSVEDRVILLQGDLLRSLPEPVDVIIANLPYVSSADMASVTVGTPKSEPVIALAGGPEGLDQIGRLLEQAPAKLKPNGVVLLEIGCQQGQAVTDLAKTAFPKAMVDLFKDLAGLDRMVAIET